MSRRRPLFLAALALSFLSSPPSLADKPYRYPEAKHGRGELKYVDGIPVLTVKGSPEEIGAQWGALALKPAVQVTKLADESLTDYGWKPIYNLVLRTGNVLLVRFPPKYVRELDAAVKASGWPREFLTFGNTIVDLRHIVQCSAVIIEGGQSVTGGPLFGRNLDWPPIANIQEYTLVVVYRPTGKRAFASVALPGMLGCSSGMNDAGLALAMLDATSTKDGSASYNPAGLPTLLLLRRVLEECASVDGAAKLILSVERASSLNIAICDRQRAAVLEVTPKSVVMRASENGVAICTNHFRSADLVTSTDCWRYESLVKSIHRDKYTVADIAQRLHAVNLGELTMQTMIFEPSALKLHLAFGKGPATQLPMTPLELSELFQSAETP